MLLVRNQWTLRGNYCETHWQDVPHVIFENAYINADELFFFHNRAPLVLRNSRVDVTGNVDHRNDPTAIWIDEKSRLTSLGKDLKGIAPRQPAATQPTTPPTPGR
jgi:hypothetical protein